MDLNGGELLLGLLHSTSIAWTIHFAALNEHKRDQLKSHC
jgi:hypothetical protein